MGYIYNYIYIVPKKCRQSQKICHAAAALFCRAPLKKGAETRGLEQRLLQSHHESELENFEKYQELRNSLPLQ